MHNGHFGEKTQHPCQFPVALVQRLVKGLVPPKGIVFDPFMGSGTTGVAAIIEKRKFIGAELDSDYYDIAYDRCKKAVKREIEYRPVNKPITRPSPNQQITKVPDCFKHSSI